MMLETYGAFEAGKVYDLPQATAKSMLRQRRAKPSRERDVTFGNKAMKACQVLKGGL